MKKLFLSTMILVILNSCYDDTGKKLSIDIVEINRKLTINVRNNSGNDLCVPTSYLNPSVTAEVPNGLAEGKIVWRSQRRMLINGEREAKSGDVSDYSIITGSTEINKYLDPVFYPSGAYNIVIDGAICRDLFSKKDNIDLFTVYQSIVVNDK